jgi:hypothetical protein
MHDPSEHANHWPAIGAYPANSVRCKALVTIFREEPSEISSRRRV